MAKSNPVAALRNIRQSMAPGGRLCIVVWRKREDSPALYRARQIVEALVPQVDKGDAVTCGPGPFSMSGADLVGDQLLAAGWTRPCFERNQLQLSIGSDIEDAINFALALGPAGELGEAKRPEVIAAMRAAFAPFVKDDGVWMQSSSWKITAVAPSEPTPELVLADEEGDVEHTMGIALEGCARVAEGLAEPRIVHHRAHQFLPICIDRVRAETAGCHEYAHCPRASRRTGLDGGVPRAVKGDQLLKAALHII